MSQESDDSGSSKPPELSQVMRALREEGPGVARLEEVARRLGPHLDAALPATSAVSSWLSLVLKSTLARVLLAGLTLGGTVYWWQARAALPGTSGRHEEVGAAPARSLASAPALVVDAAEPARSVVPAPALEQPPVEPVAEVSATLSARAPTRPRRARAATPVQRLSPPASAVDLPQVESVPAAPVARVAQAESTLEPAAQEQAPEPPRARSELDLIYGARTAAVKEPRAALALLDEHLARFPQGLLTPEREVLSIEVLRRLGKNAAAATRLAVFRQRYPDSVHLRRLEQGTR